MSFWKWFLLFLTREYAKRNEWVIEDDDKFTHSLGRSPTRSFHHLAVNLVTKCFVTNALHNNNNLNPAIFFLQLL